MTTIARPKPATVFPVIVLPATPANAPTSIIPSMPMLNIPARCTTVSPIAARNIGADSRTAEAQKNVPISSVTPTPSLRRGAATSLVRPRDTRSAALP